MKVSVLAVLFLFGFVEIFSAGTPCSINGTTGGTINTLCNNKKGKENYCRNINQNSAILIPSYECVQCLTNCDCKENQYCSQATGTIGQCKKFEKSGDDCYPYNDNQLRNASFPDDLKCAYTFQLPVSGLLAIDQRGACVGFKCHSCSAYSGGGLDSCDNGDGIEGERVCAPPGTQTRLHTAYWTPGVYYLFVNNVWWAIFFCLLIITITMQIMTCIGLKKRAGKGSSKNEKDKSYNSSHTSEIGAHNTTNQHSTISPSTPSTHNTAQQGTAPQSGHSSSTPVPYDNPPSKHSTVEMKPYDSPPEKKDPPPYEDASNRNTQNLSSARNTQNLSEVNY